MATKKKFPVKIIVIIAVLVLVIVIYKEWKKQQEAKETAAALTENASISMASGATPAPTAPIYVPGKTLDRNKSLSKGTNGEEVKYLQRIINWNNALSKKPPISVDGAFGSQTESAVKAMNGGNGTITIEIAASIYRKNHIAKKGVPPSSAQVSQTGSSSSTGFFSALADPFGLFI